VAKTVDNLPWQDVILAQPFWISNKKNATCHTTPMQAFRQIKRLVFQTQYTEASLWWTDGM
jgi:hypothetical protein